MTEMIHRGLRRFYKTAQAGCTEDGLFTILLDGKPVRTPAKRALAVPTLALAEAVAAEWAAQGEKILPATMPLTRLANTALDRPTGQKEEVVAELVRYAGSDHLCYWAQSPDDLVERHKTHWQPILDWATTYLDASFAVIQGIVPQPQPHAALKAVQKALEAMDVFRLTAVHSLAGAFQSVLLALAVDAGRLDPDQAFTLSQIDETYQIEQWGEDEEAAERRDAIHEDVRDSAEFLRLSRSPGLG